MNCEDLSWITSDVLTFANSGEADLALFSDIAMNESIYTLRLQVISAKLQKRLYVESSELLKVRKASFEAIQVLRVRGRKNRLGRLAEFGKSL